MPLNPIKGVAVKAVGASGLSKAAVRYVKNRQGGIEARAGGRRSRSTDPVVRRLTASGLSTTNLNGRRVSWIYSQNSRVMQGTDVMLAVKLNTGERGWLTDTGDFLGEKDLRDVLHSVDSTTAAAVQGISLADMFDAMNPAQRAQFAERVRDFDWDAFWAEFYPAEGNPDLDSQMDLYMELLELIGDLIEGVM